MTPTEKRIKIAERCGLFALKDGWKIPRTIFGIPDYLSDLNAMHSAFLVLSFDEQIAFVAQLLADQHGVDRDYFNKISWSDAPQLVNATAQQRADAFLRTIGEEP